MSVRDMYMYVSVRLRAFVLLIEVWLKSLTFRDSTGQGSDDRG